METFLSGSIGVAAVGALLFAGARWLEHILLYVPGAEYTPPHAAGLAAVEEILLPTPDGHRVLAWWGQAQPGQFTLLYFHGNGGTLASRAERIAAYLAQGQGIFMMAYRGYGGSTGTPSERANVADALLAFDTLAGKGVPPRNIILYGESLGTGVAVQVAAARRPGGLILDAPYTSIADVGARAYPYLPVKLLMRDRYETMRFIGQVQAPLLVIHGDRDQVIPVHMGEKVYAAAPGPKEIAIIPGAGHTNHYEFGSFAIVQDWLRRLCQHGRAPAAAG